MVLIFKEENGHKSMHDKMLSVQSPCELVFVTIAVYLPSLGRLQSMATRTFMSVCAACALIADAGLRACRENRIEQIMSQMNLLSTALIIDKPV